MGVYWRRFWLAAAGGVPLKSMSEAGAAGRARVQARTVRAREAFVRERYGANELEHYHAAVSPPLRALFADRSDPPGGWVEFPLFVEANVTADRLFGHGNDALSWEIGRFAATHNLGVWKGMFMRHMRPTTFMGIAGGLWGSHYDGGKLLSRAHGQNGLYVTIADFPSPHRSHCLSIAGWIHGSLEIGPRSNIAVDETACRVLGDDKCEFLISWDD